MKLGKYTDTGAPAKLSLEELIDSRMLIQANSGGGKSYAVRRVLEESHGKVQQIVIDLEGEFATLREKFDYLLVGKDGDLPLNIKSAELLALKLLELNVSAILDLSELKKHERLIFVKRFLEAIIEAPKRLWHPVMVVVDEGHIFCPEKEKAESAPAVIDMATRGRKRGYFLVLATQRISKLKKDVAAELNNKMIGRTGLDIDQKRAADELGFTSKQQKLSLRDLKPGEFFVFGPAISQGVRRMKVGKVKTTHPRRGQRILTKITPPTRKIKQMLQKLTDLPKEAEKELKTKEDMKTEIHRLKIELRKSQHLKPAPAPTQPDERQITRAYQKGVTDTERIFTPKLREANQTISGAYHKGVSDTKSHYIHTERQHTQKLREANHAIRALRGIIKRIQDTCSKQLPEEKEVEVQKTEMPTPTPPPEVRQPSIESPPPHTPYTAPEKEDKIMGGALRMLRACATFYPKGISRARMGTISGLAYKGGSFGTYLATLKRNGLITTDGSNFTITEEGLSKIGDVEPIPSDPQTLIDMWADILKGGAGRMLKALGKAYPETLTREELCYKAGMESFTSGSFGTYLATLKRNSLITVSGQDIKAADELFGGLKNGKND